jgi:hypothetical protein
MVGAMVVPLLMRDRLVALPSHHVERDAGPTQGHFSGGRGSPNGAAAGLERSDRCFQTAPDTRTTMARQRRTLAAIVSGTALSNAPVRPITALPPGTLLVMFGGLAELVAVDHDPYRAFPGGRLITIRPAAGGEPVSVLVPADFEPVALQCNAAANEAPSVSTRPLSLLTRCASCRPNAFERGDVRGCHAVAQSPVEVQHRCVGGRAAVDRCG